jgi:hypothetical protein
MNVTLLNAIGTGTTALWRMTSGHGVEALDKSISIPSSVAQMHVLALEILITTGVDNLDSGSDNNASVVLHLKSGDVPTNSINESNEWAAGALHTAFLAFPQGMTADNITGFSITTDFPGKLIGGENWDIYGVTLEAAVAA